MLIYTTIVHGFRKENGLSCNEYVLCDMVFYLSSNSNSNVPGWCYMAKEQIGIELGLTKQAVLNMIERLIQNGFLIKNPQTKFVKTSDKWQQVYFDTSVARGKETLPAQTLFGKETLLANGKETLPYKNNTDNNTIKDIIDKKKEKFFNEITEFKNSNPGKYPSSFYAAFFSYWTEPNASKTKMRKESETYFDIKRRLLTFWNRTSEEQKQIYWNLDKNNNNGHSESK